MGLAEGVVRVSFHHEVVRPLPGGRQIRFSLSLQGLSAQLENTAERVSGVEPLSIITPFPPLSLENQQQALQFLRQCRLDISPTHTLAMCPGLFGGMERYAKGAKEHDSDDNSNTYRDNVDSDNNDDVNRNHPNLPPHVAPATIQGYADLSPESEAKILEELEIDYSRLELRPHSKRAAALKGCDPKTVPELVNRLNKIWELLGQPRGIHEKPSKKPKIKGEEAERLQAEALALKQLALEMIWRFVDDKKKSEGTVRQVAELTKCHDISIHAFAIRRLVGAVITFAETTPPYMYKSLTEAVQQADHLEMRDLLDMMGQTFHHIQRTPLNQVNKEVLKSQFGLMAEVLRQMVVRHYSKKANFPAEQKDFLYHTMRAYRNIFKGRPDGDEKEVSNFVRELTEGKHHLEDPDLAYLAVCVKEGVANLDSDRKWVAHVVPFVGDVIAIGAPIAVAVVGGNAAAAIPSLKGFYKFLVHVKKINKTKGNWYLHKLKMELYLDQVKKGNKAEAAEAWSKFRGLLIEEGERLHNWYLLYGISSSLKEVILSVEDADIRQKALTYLKLFMTDKTKWEEFTASFKDIDISITKGGFKNSAKQVIDEIRKLVKSPKYQKKAWGHFEKVHKKASLCLEELFDTGHPEVSPMALKILQDANPETAPKGKSKETLNELTPIENTLLKSTVSESKEWDVQFSEMKSLVSEQRNHSLESTYIPLECTEGGTGMGQPKSLHHTVREFLYGDQKVMLLHGLPGAGKTWFVQWLKHQMWESYDWSGYGFVPSYLSLSGKGVDEKQIMTGGLKEYLDDKTIKYIKTKRKFLFIFDGYNEGGLTENLYSNYELWNWPPIEIYCCFNYQLYQAHRKF